MRVGKGASETKKKRVAADRSPEKERRRGGTQVGLKVQETNECVVGKVEGSRPPEPRKAPPRKLSVP